MTRISILEKNEMKELTSIITHLSNIQADSLSKLLLEPLTYTMKKLVVTQLSQIENTMPLNREGENFAIYIKCEGDLKIGFLFVISVDKTRSLTSRLLGKNVSNGMKLERSAIAEAGNIMTGTFLNVLSLETGLQIRQSPPGISVDVMPALFGTPLAVISETTNEVVIAEGSIKTNANEILIHTFIILEPHGARKILDKYSGDLR